MTNHNQRVGIWGEETAVRYIAKRGLQVIARNVRTPYGEIDIIAKQGDIIIFVEVKTLTSSKKFFPEQHVTARKRQHMIHAAEHYASEHEVDHWQIDVIAIEGRPGNMPSIIYFENAL